jgi:signal transduction histidine kinase
MYNSLVKRFFIIFISVILNTFFVASFVLFQFSKYVSQPLENISKIVRQASIDQSHLLSRPTSSDDNLNELEEIDIAISKMRNNFQNSHNELMKTQEQIENMKKISTIGELTASVSHDFKNFLSIMIHTLEILKRNGENQSFNINDEKNQKHISNAFDAAEKANNLITTLLDYSYHHKKEPINLNLHDHLLTIKGLLEVAVTKRIQLNIELKNQQINNCYLDVNILDSALLNLCVNAKDAIKNNGEIHIELSNIEITNRTQAQNGGYVLLKFRDNGHGMSAEVQKKIFEPFYTTKPAGKGTGLGLSMVSNFVKNSGGFVEVQSIEGVGTSFFLYFKSV